MSDSNVCSLLPYWAKNRLAADRIISGIPAGMAVREKSGASQNSASAADTWTRRSGRNRSFTPSTSSPPMWSKCIWVSTTSVTSARSMPAANSREDHCPVRGKSGASMPSPESMRMVRPPLRTTTSFSAQSITSGCSLSCIQAERTAGSALVAMVSAEIDIVPSLITVTSISPIRSA